MYVEMLKALNSMLTSSILYYKNFRKDIERIGYIVNPYDPCVANCVIKGSQQTVTWHDDLKSSHKKPKGNDDFNEWLTKKNASDGIGKLKVVDGTRHEYLAINLDYGNPGMVNIDMVTYVIQKNSVFKAQPIRGAIPFSKWMKSVQNSTSTSKKSSIHSFTEHYLL